MGDRRKTARRVGALCAAAAAFLIGTPAASASSAGHAPVVSDPIVDGLAGPLQFQVDHGRILVAQSFSGTVSRIGRDGAVTDLFNDPGVDGVTAGPWGSTITTFTSGVGPDVPPGSTPVGELRLHTRSGATRTIADLRRHEVRKNPDAAKRYGIMGLSDECAAMFPPDAGLLPYRGIVESHPYSVTAFRGGWLVADAGSNDILSVDWRGHVRTVAVLPAQEPVVISAEAAAANQLPDCVVGASYVAEGVPTDVEVGPNGMLYVSALPGGPEDPSLGARGKVYRINPWSGRVTEIGHGIAGAANVAVAPNGTVYVSELFGDQVSKLVHGSPVAVASVPSPSGLEWDCGRLYAGIDTFGSGKIVTITP